ncbi:MAG: TraR/DksA C4-type zinc finger protein [Gracilimonas sp.]|nr:TraR/DksA C4-type zinc finger protein [Gracilimonas sp.]
MTNIIFTMIKSINSEIEELTKPANPDKAIGRLSRMDAINNKSTNESALREQKDRLQKLNRALEKIEEDNFGKCVKCGNVISIGRLEYMPWTSKCINCA